MLIIVLLAMANGVWVQKTFDFCLKENFIHKECKLYEKAVLANPGSKHYDRVQALKR